MCRVANYCRSDKRKIIFWATIASVVCAFFVAIHWYAAHRIHARSDAALARFLYADGFYLVLLGAVVSLKPPTQKTHKLLIVALFLNGGYAGWVIASEQAERIESASRDLVAAQDNNAKAQERYESKVDEVEKIVENLARNSHEDKWQVALNEIKKIRPIVSVPVTEKLDPERELLGQGQKEQFKLCKLLNAWELEWRLDTNRARSMPEIQRQAESDLHREHDPERAKEYAACCQADAVSLRLRMIEAVPGIADPSVQYSRLTNPNDIDRIYTDFYNLVVALRTKVDTGNYKVKNEKGAPMQLGGLPPSWQCKAQLDVQRRD